MLLILIKRDLSIDLIDFLYVFFTVSIAFSYLFIAKHICHFYIVSSVE